jgi:hypothetical protein
MFGTKMERGNSGFPLVGLIVALVTAEQNIYVVLPGTLITINGTSSSNPSILVNQPHRA